MSIKRTTWICNSLEHEWKHTIPFNDCVVVKPFKKGDEYGAGTLMKCLHSDEEVLFRILTVESP